MQSTPHSSNTPIARDSAQDSPQATAARMPAVSSWVVRCPNWVGDVVMATPVFESLRANYPDAVITALIRPYARGIIEHSPWFDHIINCDDKSVRGLLGIRRALAGNTLSGDSGQAGLLLTNTTHSFLTLKLAGVKRVYGYRRNLRRFFLTDGPAPQTAGKAFKALPMQEYYLELCRFLGMSLPTSPKPKLYIDEDLAMQGRQYLAAKGVAPGDLLIGINPGASFGSSKCWPAENFAQLAELLQKFYRCKLILLVGPGEESIARRIMAAAQAEIINTADDMLNLAQLKPVIQRCNLLITNDTGPRHFAVAFDVPTVVLMGPTNPLFTATNLNRTTVIRLDLPCSPCHKKICPYQHHACMNEITPAMVLTASSKYLPAAAS